MFAKGTLKKSLLPPRWKLLMAQIIQCLRGKTRGFDQITNKDAIILYFIANGVNIEYAMIFWEDIINKLKKKNREKVVPYTRFLSFLMMQKMKDGYGDGDVTIHPTQIFKKPMDFKAPKPSSNAERVPQGTKPEAKPKHKKHSTLKQPLVSSSETSASTLVVVEMHKEDLQATGGPTSLAVTSEARANPQLTSGMSAFNLNKPIYSTSFIIHSQSASKNDASAISIAGVDPRISAPSTDPHVLVGKTKSVSDGLETVLTTPKTGTSNAAKTSKEIKFGAIKLEDLAKLVPNVKVDFKDLDSPEDDLIIVVDDSEEDEEDKNAEIHSTTNNETEDISASTPPSLRLKAQPFFPNMGHLNEHLVKSLTAEFSKILSAHNFSSSLPTELKDLPSKFDKLTEEVKGLKKQVHELEIELPGDLKEIPSKLEEFTKTITSLTSQVAELKTLQWELIEEFVSLHVQVESVQAKLQTLDALPAGEQSVPSAGQADTMPAEGEKNINQATISQLF
ncbi:hypothetical protein Tco_0847596 [Tanacetum coccineum]